jgi:hypothetical protein
MIPETLNEVWVSTAADAEPPPWEVDDGAKGRKGGKGRGRSTPSGLPESDADEVVESDGEEEAGGARRPINMDRVMANELKGAGITAKKGEHGLKLFSPHLCTTPVHHLCRHTTSVTTSVTPLFSASAHHTCRHIRLRGPHL